MTKTEMEDAITNCNRQLSAIEQILPTLATKEDLERSETRTAVIIESLRDDIHKVAEGYAEHDVKLQALESIAKTVTSHTFKLDAVAATVTSHSTKLDAIGTAVTTLTERLEHKGLI